MQGQDASAAEIRFENAEWLVSAEGLEHRRTGYFIVREQIGRRRDDGCWAWPMHMLEKSWVAPAPFVEAFESAVRLFGLPVDGRLARSFRESGLPGFDPEDVVGPAAVPPVPEPALRPGTEAVRTAMRRVAPRRDRRLRERTAA